MLLLSKQSFVLLPLVMELARLDVIHVIIVVVIVDDVVAVVVTADVFSFVVAIFCY